MAEPIVSVCIITYNHAKYISQAIDSVLMQETDFEFNLVISDDFSKDGTRDILMDYQKKYPDKIELILQTGNVGPARNWNDLMTFPKSQYIAYLEGDDYWEDPLKLQKQVGFLEENPKYGMSFHAVRVQGEYETNYQYKTPPSDTLTFRDLAFHHYIPSCSLLFRRDIMPNPIPEWLLNCRIGDIPFELIMADKCLTKYFNEQMAVYRKHSNSVTNNPEQVRQGRKAYIEMYSKLNRHLKYKYRLIFFILITKTRLGRIKDLFNKRLKKGLPPDHK